MLSSLVNMKRTHRETRRFTSNSGVRYMLDNTMVSFERYERIEWVGDLHDEDGCMCGCVCVRGVLSVCGHRLIAAGATCQCDHLKCCSILFLHNNPLRHNLACNFSKTRRCTTRSHRNSQKGITGTLSEKVCFWATPSNGILRLKGTLVFESNVTRIDVK